MQEIAVIVNQKDGEISFNFAEIKEMLNSELEAYRRLVFTEDTKKEAKATVADLRKLKKSMNDRKVQVKKEFMKPYELFESQVKELDGLIEEPITYINEQVEEFERKRIQEKRELIQKIYDELVDGMQEYIPLKKIYDNRWENATVSEKTIREAISAHSKNAKQDVEVLMSMKSDAVEKAIELYKQTLSIAEAATYIYEYEERKKEILQREEERRRLEVERQQAVKQAEDAPVPEVAPVVDPAQKMPEVTGWTLYHVKADKFQTAKLEAVMREYGIEFRKEQ